MPQLERWDNLPQAVRHHLVQRMRDRTISVTDLNQLRLWVETRPQVPEGDWYKGFGSFKICGRGAVANTFSAAGPSSFGREAPVKPDQSGTTSANTNPSLSTISPEDTRIGFENPGAS